MRRFVERHAATTISERASEWLRVTQPQLSAATRPWIARAVIAVLTIALALATAAYPSIMIGMLLTLITALFLAWSVLRIWSALKAPPLRAPALTFTDHSLPCYTIIVALFEEVAALPGLIDALRALDYPAEKLDIKLLLEIDDPRTRFAADFMQLQRPFEIILVPASTRFRSASRRPRMPSILWLLVVDLFRGDKPS